jgi:NAD+ synthase
MDPIAREIVDWLRQRMTMAGARGFVVGLSGGLDSAVVLKLCHLAAPEQVAAAILPCGSDPKDEADAQLVADHFGVPRLLVDLELPYNALVAATRSAIDALPREMTPTTPSEAASRVPLANVRPRLRMTTLYLVANSLNYLVAGTGNKSEVTIGYFTKHGDGAVDLLPIGHLLKRQVHQLAKSLDVPQAILDKPPSAGLWPGQTDEEEMGVSYTDLERYLTDGPEGVSPALALRLERLIRLTEHKRVLPPTPES